MSNSRNTRKFAFLFALCFVLLCSPYFLLGKGENKGNLVGFVYRADGTTPLQNGIVTIRNISTGAVYGIVESDNFGAFKIEGIEKGLYLVSISTKGRSYKVRNLIGVQAERTSKVSFSLLNKKDPTRDGKLIRTVRVMASSEPIVFGTLGTTGDEQGDDQGNIEGDDQGDDQGDEQGDDQGDNDDDEDEDNPSPHKPHPPNNPPPNNPPPNNPGNVNN